MNKTIKKWTVLLAAAAVFFSGIIFTASAAGSTISFSSSKPKVNDSVTVTVTVNADEAMYAVEFSVNYNAEILRFESGENAYGGGGTVKVVSALSGAVQHSYSLRFTAIAAGSSPVQVTGCMYAADTEKSFSGASVNLTVSDAAEDDEPYGDYWKYDALTGTLTVSGNTYLKDYTSGYYAQEWADVKNQIGRLEIINADGKIGAYAFSKLTSLKEVTICEGITAIGKGSFESCAGLEKINFPQSVREIEEGAFQNSGLLGKLDLSGVPVIGDGAFRNTPVSEIRFSPETVYLGFEAFSGTGLQKAVFSGEAEFIAQSAFRNSADAVIYCSKGSKVEKYASENGTPYSIFGDLNGDREINTVDIVQLRKVLLEMESGYDALTADINYDGRIDLSDLIRMKKIFLQK